MIKILFFIETLEGGGAEKVLRDLVNHMDQTKFAITVQTVWPCDSSKLLAPGIRYKTTYREKNKLNQQRYRVEAELGILYQLHIKDDYDIECAYLEMGPTKVMAASTNKKAKKLAWVHCDLTKAVGDPSAYARKTASWYAKYDQVVCVSKNVKETFDALYQHCFPSYVLYNVIDDASIMEKAGLLPEMNIGKHRLTVLSLGRLTEQKNYLRLLKAHKRLLDEGIPHDLWIFGEGPQRRMLEQYIEEHDLKNSVLLPGFLENPYPYMKEADLLACSSNYEGFSTFLTEGLILGKPIITTIVTGVREQMGDSEFALVVDNNDEAFYQGLKKMLCDDSLRKDFAAKAERHGHQFTAEELTNKNERYFEELLIS